MFKRPCPRDESVKWTLLFQETRCQQLLEKNKRLEQILGSKLGPPPASAYTWGFVGPIAAPQDSIGPNANSGGSTAQEDGGGSAVTGEDVTRACGSLLGGGVLAPIEPKQVLDPEPTAPQGPQLSAGGADECGLVSTHAASWASTEELEQERAQLMRDLQSKCERMVELELELDEVRSPLYLPTISS